MLSLNDKRVLVIENDYFIATDLTQAIQAVDGIVIGPFATVDEAKQALIEGVDLAVVNIRVRDGVTYLLAEQLYGLCIPFVFISGHANHTKPEKWRLHPWISKPFDPGEVVRWLVNAAASPDHGKPLAHPA